MGGLGVVLGSSWVGLGSVLGHTHTHTTHTQHTHTQHIHNTHTHTRTTHTTHTSTHPHTTHTTHTQTSKPQRRNLIEKNKQLPIDPGGCYVSVYLRYPSKYLPNIPQGPPK